MNHVVTGLEVQQHNTDRVSLYLDGEFAFGLPIMEAARLREGQELTNDEVERLRALDEVARAFDRAVLLLARRPYSVNEIRRHLQSKDISPSAIQAALQRLEDLGYLDDRAFAAYWVENRERFRPRGPRALRYELRQKGIAEEIVGEVLGTSTPRSQPTAPRRTRRGDCVGSSAASSAAGSVDSWRVAGSVTTPRATWWTA